ncbi:MAG: 50S ribosomal protein L29 [Deltaproteobacteria bacterium]|nr:50S ribosomal protein L29 [Deltaproteobacteria bacterium]
MKRREYLKEIKGLSATDLQERARALADELMKLRFRKATNQLDRSHQLRQIRRNLARVETLLTSSRKAKGGSGDLTKSE